MGYWPVEVLLQFDALTCFQVSQATQKASGRVKGHFEELDHWKEREKQAMIPHVTESRENNNKEWHNIILRECTLMVSYAVKFKVFS